MGADAPAQALARGPCYTLDSDAMALRKATVGAALASYATGGKPASKETSCVYESMESSPCFCHVQCGGGMNSLAVPSSIEDIVASYVDDVASCEDDVVFWISPRPSLSVRVQSGDLVGKG